jgi:hypothetical protein
MSGMTDSNQCVQALQWHIKTVLVIMKIGRFGKFVYFVI